MNVDDRMIDGDKMDEIMLPGFRFHPTDEELVAFYLKRKIQQRPLAIELIKQLDIYKHDPWDLPKLAATGEKEWYFYCPRDRKYRNSARPNRVTGAGFWKATGTDRPIYSSEGNKCIGLKKSLVFYKGRAAKGIKTDWMMHEFRLPSLVDTVHPKRFVDKAIPANDAWAICRIFKKTNTTAQRAVSHSWISPDNNNLMMLPKSGCQSSQLSSTERPNIVHMTPNPSYPNHPLYSSYNTSHHHQQQQQSCAPNFSSPDLNCYNYKPIYTSTTTSQTLQTNEADRNSILMSNSNMMIPHDINSGVVSSILLNISASSTTAEESTFCKPGASDSSEFNNHFPDTLLHQYVLNGATDQNHHLQEVLLKHENDESYAANLDDSWSLLQHEYGFSVNNSNDPAVPSDAWKSNLVWDASPCPSEMSTNYKCYT